MNINSLGHVPPGVGIHRQGAAPADADTAGNTDAGTPTETQAGALTTTHGQETTFEQTENGFTRTRTKTLHDGRELSKTITVEHTDDGVSRTVTVTNPNGKINTSTSVLLDDQTLNQLVGIESPQQEEEAATTEPVVTTAAATDQPATVDPASVGGGLIDELLQELLSDGEEEPESEGEIPASLIV